jgi:hypothetical protein
MFATLANCESSIATNPANTININTIAALVGKNVPIVIALVTPTIELGISSPAPAAKNPNSPIHIGTTIKTKLAIMCGMQLLSIHFCTSM